MINSAKSNKGTVCNLVYTTKIVKQYRRVYGNAHKCKQCQFISRSIFTLTNHLDRHDLPPMPFDCERANLEEFLCKECDFSTPFVIPFKEHIRNHPQEVKAGKKFDADLTQNRKKNCCLYCRRSFANIAKHLELKHRLEPEVREISALPKGSRERVQKISLIRKKGNFLHCKSSDSIIPCRIPSQGQRREYMFCPRCHGAYSKLTIRRHFPTCLGPGHSTKDTMELSRRMSAKVHPLANESLVRVFCRMKDTDDVAKAIRWDPLIVSYGNKLVEKFKDRKHYLSMRSDLRLLGRFLLEMRKKSQDVTNLASIYDPKFYKYVASVDNEMSTVKSALKNVGIAKDRLIKVRTLLKKVGKHLTSYYEETGQDEHISLIENFLKLFNRPSLQSNSSSSGLSKIDNDESCGEISASIRLEKELRVVLTPLEEIHPELAHVSDDDENFYTSGADSDYEWREITRHTWTDAEKKLVDELFKESFSSLTLPRFILCKQAVQEHSQLRNRTDKQLYAYINNCIQNRKRKSAEFPRHKISRNAWTLSEKTVVSELFNECFTSLRLPKFAFCEQVVLKHPELKHRTAAQLYAYVNNSIRKTKQDSASTPPHLEKQRSETISRNRWTDAEKDIVHNFFKESFENLTLPSFILCEQVVRYVPQLQNRTDKQLYAYINNRINKLKREGTDKSCIHFLTVEVSV